MSTASRLALAALTTSTVVALSPMTPSTPPATGVGATTLWQTTVGGKDLVLREITIPPGETTGWHWHDGKVLGVVKKGTLTHHEADCSVDGIYRAGSTINEESGSGYVHTGRNLGNVPVVLDVLYINPKGKPLSEAAPNPGCNF